ncbi:MAG: archease [Chloroflexi bacterium]|nr:archease [Chloroflexota bacterium]
MEYSRLIEHTADIGIEVWGASPEELFEHSAQAFFELMWNVPVVLPERKFDISENGNSYEELLVMLLSDLLYLHEAESVVFNRLEIVGLTPREVRAVAYGEPFDGGRHKIKTMIKAVTYHEIEVRQKDGGWVVRIIFDI